MIDPAVLFFAAGVAAKLVRSDLRLPEPLYEALSLYLLLALGLKGGVELSRHPLGDLLAQSAAVAGMGVLLPLLAFAALLLLGRVKRDDAASIAAHYGSVSVVTFAAGLAYLERKGVTAESYMALFVAILEIPGIVVGIMLARGSAGARWPLLLREVFGGKSVFLLIAGLAIGALLGPEGVAPIRGLFFDLFRGVLCLFLLELGLVAGKHILVMHRTPAFLIGFAVFAPLAFSVIGTAIGAAIGLSPGGIALLATLAASASYIAAPAAMRIAIPQADAGLSLSMVLGITFPFNILAGIPLYFQMASWLGRGT